MMKKKKLFIKIYETALHIAAQKENINIIKILLTHKNIDCNIVDNVFHDF